MPAGASAAAVHRNRRPSSTAVVRRRVCVRNARNFDPLPGYEISYTANVWTVREPQSADSQPMMAWNFSW